MQETCPIKYFAEKNFWSKEKKLGKFIARNQG